MTQVNLSKKSKQTDMQIRPAVAKAEGGEGEVGVWGEQTPSITHTHTHTHTHILFFSLFSVIGISRD